MSTSPKVKVKQEPVESQTPSATTPKSGAKRQRRIYSEEQEEEEQKNEEAKYNAQPKRPKKSVKTEDDEEPEEKKPKKAATDKTKPKPKKETTAKTTAVPAAKRSRAVKGPADLFLATFPQWTLLKRLVDCYKALTEQVQFQLCSDAIRVQFLDSSHVSMCENYLDQADFDAYQHTRDLCVGVGLNNLVNTLKFSKHIDGCSLTLSAAPSWDSVMLQMDGEGRKFAQKVPLMDIDEEQLGIPEYEADWIVDMSTEDYQIFAACKELCDSVHIKVEERALHLALYDKITGCTRFRFGSCGTDPPEDDGGEAVIAKGQVFIRHNRTENEYGPALVQTYALRYLNFFDKGCALSTNGRVKLIFSNTMPLAIRFPILSRSHIRFFLAPKIEDYVGGDNEADQRPIASLFNDEEDDDNAENSNAYS